MNANYVNANNRVTSFGNYFPSLEDNKGISNYLKVKIAKGPGWCLWNVRKEISELQPF
jgi:hypothetical protein